MFCFEDFVYVVVWVDYVYNFLDWWVVDFFVFGGNEEGCGVDKLEFVEWDNFDW